jgi:uncharacterized membrane protein
MLLAAIGSNSYKVMLVLHLFAVVVAFAPAFVWPVVNRNRRIEGTKEPQDVSGLQGDPMPATAPAGGGVAGIIDPILHGGAMVLAGLFGIFLVIMSSDFFKFSQSWISIAFVLWFVMLAVFFAGLVPAQRAIREGKVAAESKLAMSYGGMHLVLVLQIIVMVFKPGL